MPVSMPDESMPSRSSVVWNSSVVVTLVRSPRPSKAADSGIPSHSKLSDTSSGAAI